MPTYDYRCDACGHALEIFHSITEKPKKKCPACGKQKLVRLIGAGAGFLFKGSGFYLTDYRSESYKAAEKGERKQASGDTAPAATEKPADKQPEKTAEKGAEKASQPEVKAGESKPEGSAPAKTQKPGVAKSSSAKRRKS